MPLPVFSDAAEVLGYDPAKLAARFGCSVPAVFRRLASLPDRRIGLVVCDGSGALTLRKATDLLPMPRFGSACALWPLYRALTRPMAPVRAVLEHSGRPGDRFLCYALAHAQYPQGFDGAAVFESAMILIPPSVVAVGPGPEAGARPADRIGTTCRVCPIEGCSARRDPSILGEGAPAALT